MFTPSLRRFLLASEPTMGYEQGPLAPHRWPRFLLRASSKGDPLPIETCVLCLDKHVHARKPWGSVF